MRNRACAGRSIRFQSSLRSSLHGSARPAILSDCSAGLQSAPLQASAAMARIEALLNNQKESQAAQTRAEKIAKTIETEYYDQRKLCYAFSRGKDGSLDRTRTVYPALAWWDP